MRAAGYIRVSTTDQATNGLSLQAQRDLLTRYAQEHGMTLVEIYADEGKSAAKSLEKREALLRMLRDAESGRFEVILFKDITRWSRSSSQYFAVQERLDACHVGWIAVEQPYLETVSPTGRFQVSVMLGTSQLEADQTAQRIKFCQDAEVERGFYPFPPHAAPFGFTTEKRDGHNHLIPKPEEAEIIRDIYATYLRTGNVTRTAEAMQAKYGLVRTPSNLHRTIMNPIYKGEFRGVPFCEPLITPEDWERAQRIGTNRICKSKYDYVFSGITYCGICGAKMKWNAPDGYKSARCVNHFNTITEREMERQVIEQIEPDLNQYRIEISKRPPQTKLRQRYEDKLKRLTDLYVDGVISREEFDERRKETQTLLEQIETPTVPDLPLNWKDLYFELSAVQKNVLWKTTVDHFSVRDKTVTIAFDSPKVLAERMAILAEETETASD